MLSKKSRNALKRMAKRFGLIGEVILRDVVIFTQQQRKQSSDSVHRNVPSRSRWGADVHPGFSTCQGSTQQRGGESELSESRHATVNPGVLEEEREISPVRTEPVSGAFR